MGINPYLLELAKTSVKMANFEQSAPPNQPVSTPPKMGPFGPRKHPMRKKADVPPTPMSAPNMGPGMPPAPATPPTNGAPVPPAQSQQFGGVAANPVQQTNQMQPPVTTSHGAGVPPPPQGAAQRAPGLVKPTGG